MGNGTIGNGLGFPLRGIRVVAVEQYISGPYCTMLLADAGAEIIKIEQPKGGDPRRSIGPFAERSDGRRSSGGFLSYNRNKKSLTLDLRQSEGRQALCDLVAVSDVLVENLRPGVVDKLGVGYEVLHQVNPKLIYAAISGFGRASEGPYSNRPAFDIVVEAMSGIMNIVGFADREPATTLYGLPDTYTGLVTAYGIALALIQRGVTGTGQLLDISMLDCMVALNERSVINYTYTGIVPTRGVERVAGPRGAFKARDGYVALSCPTDEMWGRLAHLIGRPDLIENPDTSTGPARAARAAELRPTIEEWLADKGKEEATQLLMAAGVPAGPVQTMEEVFACEQLAAREVLLSVEDEVAGPKRVPRSPVSGSAMSLPSTQRPPHLGEHNGAVLGGLLGYDADRLAALRAKGVIA
ncbi:MAG: CaiB/BaiF CoA transferase family protein [Chloroflexota bacterium]